MKKKKNILKEGKIRLKTIITKLFLKIKRSKHKHLKIN